MLHWKIIEIICVVSSLTLFLAQELRVSNRCPYTVWPGIISDSENELLGNGGFELGEWESRNFTVSGNWSGKIWGRTRCKESGVCETGGCEGGVGIECEGSIGRPPVTIAEITFGVQEGIDEYAVSLLQGYNLPIQIRPYYESSVKKSNARYDCNLAGCFRDVNMICPRELAFRNWNGVTVGCKNPCLALNTATSKSRDKKLFGQYCNTSQWDTDYAAIFIEACPDALIFSFNRTLDRNQFTMCKSNLRGFSTYEVIFCP